jgi:hypothetical protein
LVRDCYAALRLIARALSAVSFSGNFVQTISTPHAKAHPAENKPLALQRIFAVWNQCHDVSLSRRTALSLFGGNRNPAYCRECRKRRFGNAIRR